MVRRGMTYRMWYACDMDDAITAVLIIAVATAVFSLAAAVAIGLGLLVLLLYLPVWITEFYRKRAS